VIGGTHVGGFDEPRCSALDSPAWAARRRQVERIARCLMFGPLSGVRVAGHLSGCVRGRQLGQER
jgi:hypothetical protein